MSEAPNASTPAPSGPAGELEPAAAGASPYKNLFVPLVVVPAAIVGVLVLVFVFFGAIAGHEATLEENLTGIIEGGAGEHKQKAFNLVRQIAENRAAQARGEPPPWPIGPEFLPKLRRAWEQVPADEPMIRLVLASLLAQLGDARGTDALLELAELDPAADPEGEVRFHALATLGSLGDPRSLPALVRTLEAAPDEGLRSVAAISLQRFPGDEARAALLGGLEDASLEVRANAALGLAARGDDAGAEVLHALLDEATYQGEHRRDARKFSEAKRIVESRVRAVEALARLARPEDRAAIERVAEEDDALPVREAAMAARKAWRR